MAIVRIDFSKSRTSEFTNTVTKVVEQIMTEFLSVPARENFILCQAHERIMCLYDSQNVSPERLEKIIFIQITLNRGRSDELKQKFFGELTTKISDETGEARQNIFINLVEVDKSNWSFWQADK